MLKYLSDQLHHNQFFSTAFIVSIFGGVAFYLKSIPQYLYLQIRKRIIHNVNIYQYDELFYYFETWFYENFKHKYRDVEASTKLNSTRSSAEPPPYEDYSNKIKNIIFYKQNEGGFVIKYNGKRLFISKNKKELNNTNDIKNAFLNHYSISGVRAKKSIHLLLTDIMELAIKTLNKDEIKLYTNDAEGWWDRTGIIHGKSLDNVIIKKEMKQDIINDLNNFIDSEDWYVKRAIMWKRSYAYTGSPGTGKTSLALAVANYVNRNIYSLDLNILDDNAKLRRAFQEISDNSILLIEDIDSCFKGRENIGKNSHVDFSTFINCLDGAFYKHGLITIITTNHIELMDSALLRTGRMDKKYDITNPGIEEINEYLNIFYNSTQISLPYYNKTLSMSDIQHICINHKDDSEEALKDILK